ncbi:MAG: ribosome recycling factor [Acidaminococcales bacterium]|jgi:ribosome recycling factor|nr:ribosome recycling factor [Acidaminococcales bacterium]
MGSIAGIQSDHESRMKKTIDILRSDYASIRAGRATPALLDKITVEYYGTPTPINQVANISVPEPRVIVIQPWEKNLLKSIEKAILKSDLGLNPNNDGIIIRLAIPQLTEQRRQEIVKVVKKKCEECKVVVRNIRRDANDIIKKEEKDKTVSEDEAKKAQDAMQKITDKYVKEADQICQQKEKEVMEV